jgi:hypothetical protein
VGFVGWEEEGDDSLKPEVGGEDREGDEGHRRRPEAEKERDGRAGDPEQAIAQRPTITAVEKSFWA